MTDALLPPNRPARRGAAPEPAPKLLYRYERKFLVAGHDRAALDLTVRLHPALFSVLYPPRWINNIYLDTADRSSFTDTIIGASDRVKVRLRWYGPLLGRIESPMLELKIKHGFLGRKALYRLPPFTLGDDFNADTLRRLFEQATLPMPVVHRLQLLEPALLNRYHRSYHQSADGHFRLTLDSALHYYPLHPLNNALLHRYVDPVHCVVELKYDERHDDDAQHLSSALPFRLTKSSKYAMGLAAVTGL